jgi:hypothetical protein
MGVLDQGYKKETWESFQEHGTTVGTPTDMEMEAWEQTTMMSMCIMARCPPESSGVIGPRNE